jgi:hypothetical protein
MEAKWLARNGSGSLLIFFCGWGFDHRCVAHIQSDCHDVAVVNDYRSLEFNADWVAGYKDVVVVAWSFGVWVAGWLIQTGVLTPSKAVAVNGSLNPVSNAEGIPLDTFNGTLEGLSDATLKKFMMRCCGGARGYSELQSLLPQRSLEELRQELMLLGTYFGRWTISSSEQWGKAFISPADLIFPYSNLASHWGDKATSISTPHLCFGAIKKWEELCY